MRTCTGINFFVQPKSPELSAYAVGTNGVEEITKINDGFRVDFEDGTMEIIYSVYRERFSEDDGKGETR